MDALRAVQDMADSTNRFSHWGLFRRLTWYGKRLRVMTPQEWLYRARQQSLLGVWLMKHKLGFLPSVSKNFSSTAFAFCRASGPQLPDLPWLLPPDLLEGDVVLQGDIGALGLPWTWSSKFNVWHQAPDTCQVWPSVFFSKINYREGNPHGDIRVAWEPARLQHLVNLALLAAYGSVRLRARAVYCLETRLLSWFHHNPFPIGIHYISAMECALRLLALCHALDLVRPYLHEPEQIWSTLIQMVRSHAPFLAHRASKYSSTGNHAVAEAVGLVYVGTLFSEMQEAASWYSQGLTTLEQEADRQILPDGGGVEQSFWYGLFITDLYGLVVTLLKHIQRPVPCTIQDAFDRGVSFLGTFGAAPEHLPRIGDGDSGFALSPYLRLSQVSFLCNPGLKFFPESGYSVIQSSYKEKTKLIFDHGPLGMPPSYGHGHADALSVTLWNDTEELLVDPGTYTYTGNSLWRSYFRSTAAHNTVMVDGLDQAIQDTAFIWKQPYHCEVVRQDQTPEGVIRILARHHGYEQRLHVIHWRGVVYYPGCRWLIWDWVTGSGTHRLDLHWHVAGDPVSSDVGWVIPGKTAAFVLRISGGEVQVQRGQVNPILGWRSPVYGRKEPLTTICVKAMGALPHEFVTTLTMRKDSDHEALFSSIATLKSWVHVA